MESIATLTFKGADVNTVDHDGNSPLIKAILGEHDQAMAFLYRHGASINLKNKAGFSAYIILLLEG